MKTINVYLSGPMYLGKDQATKWRNEIKDFLVNSDESDKLTFYKDVSFNVFDPTCRWLERGPELDEKGPWVVQVDKMEINKSDVLIVNATDPGWGTPMEQYIGFTSGKFVIAFSEAEYPSIWAKAHCHKMCKTPRDAAKFLVSIAEHIAGAL